MKQRNISAVRWAALCLGMLLGGLPAYAGSGYYVDHQAVVGDFNGDGWSDIILQPLSGAHGTAELIAYPDGNFGAPLATWPDQSGGTNWNADAHRLVVGDFNGDGRDDVLLQGAAGLASQIALAQPDGDVSQTDAPLPATLGGLDLSQATHHLVVGDFNGDGRDDILLQANTFVGTDGVALANAAGGFSTLAARWSDGFHGFSWSQDREALTAGDFAATGRDELLMRSTSAAGSSACCELIAFDKNIQPTQVVQQWAANFLGVDWRPSTHLAIVGDFNGDGHADVLLQPRAPGGELDIVLTDSAGLISSVADRWSSERDGVDWSSESYTLVPEPAVPGEGATLLMVPQQAGLPYRRAQFGLQGRLQSVVTIAAPADNIFAATDGTGAVSLAAVGGSGGGDSPHVLADAPAPAGDAVGAMNGAASASNGVAGYSIKIAVPPGRAGMQPAVSLDYSSNGGDGHEGVGWSLGGFSAIYRCPATMASDGLTAGTIFTSADHFCLDGAKLMLTSGTYGAIDSTYRAEVNGFSQVTITDVRTMNQGGPTAFTVTTSGGNTLYYGGSPQSNLVSPGGQVFTWALTKSVDRDGNEVDYHYTIDQSAGEYYPSEIDYTLGNGGAGATRKVTFDWETRSAEGASNIVHYLAGMKQSTTMLLTHIKTWVGSAKVRDYTLSYTQSAATARPLLHWVQACAFNSNGQTCFNPTTFNYQGEHAPQFTPVDASASLGLSAVSNGCYTTTALSSFAETAYDMTGDGRSDLMSVTGPTYLHPHNPITYWMQQGNPVGFQAKQQIAVDGGVFGTPIDFNLDGRTDILTWAAGTSAQPEQIDVGYYDGSAYTESYTGAEIPLNYNDTIGYSPTVSQPLVGDVDGDGKPDLIVFSEQTQGEYTLQVYRDTTTGSGSPPPTYALKSSFTMTTTEPINFARVLDYDADGKSDLLVHYGTDATFTLLHSMGDHFIAVPTTIAFVTNPNKAPDTQPVYYTGVPITLADVNGDSLPDVIESMDTSGTWQWYVYPNHGDGTFGAPIDTGITVQSDGGAKLNDFVKVVLDPSGRADLLIPTARTFTGDRLYPPDSCIQGGKDQNNCGYKLTSGPCTGWWSQRKDGSPQVIDGYNWHLYRPSGSNFGYSDLGQVAANIGSAPLIDFNNDGLPDIVGVQVTEGSTVNRSMVAYKFDFSAGSTGALPSPMPDLLSVAQNGLGVSDAFSYKPASDPTVYTRTSDDAPVYPEMRFASPMQVVASLQESNPAGGNNLYTYTYQDAHYNVAGRGFEGFRTISVDNHAQGTITTTSYMQHFPYIGKVSSSITTTSLGGTIATSASTWTDNVYGSGTDKRYVVYASDSSQTQVDPTAGVQISHSSMSLTGNPPTVDACGNPTGPVLRTTTTQQATQSTTTTTTYNNESSSDCSKHTVNTQTVTTDFAYLHAPTTSDSLTATTTYQYTDSSHPWRVTDKHVTAPHDGDDSVRDWSFGYDTYGNRTSVTQKDVAAGTSRATTSSYGSGNGFNAYGYFPVSVTNALGQTEYFTYDPATGNKTSATDLNGNVTDYAFDAFGRNHGGKTPGASPVDIEFLDPGAAGLSCPTAPPGVETYALRKTQAGYPTSYTCEDAFGDTLRSATQGFAADSWVYVDSTYDGLGRVLTTTAPYYAGSAPAGTTQITGYDVLGRPTGKSLPTMTGTRTITMIYTGLSIAYVDTDDTTGVTHYYTRRYDGFGKGNGHLVEVDDAAGTATYRYDAGGDLVRATDPMGNAITAGYDGFGDKLSLADPDQGNSSYTYDGYGEELTEKNARGQTITTDYDALGRPLTVSDPADNRVTTTTYDTAQNGVGKPASETVTVNGSVTYSRQYGYDTAGRASVSAIQTDPGGPTYIEGSHYGPDGRPDQRAYPALGGSTNQPPTVTSTSESPAGPVPIGTTIHLDAAASDPNGAWQLSYRWSQASGDATRASISDADSAHATVTLNTAGTYHFIVTVSDGLSTTTASVNSVQAVAPPAGAPTLSLDPTTSTTGAFNASWTQLSGAVSYELQESANGGAWSTLYTGSGQSKPISGRGAGTYQYRVSGCALPGGVACGVWSAWASETVVAPPPPQAPLASPNPSHNGAYEVQWGSISGASTYELQESVNGGSWLTKQNTSGLSWSTSGRANGTYAYRVRTCNATTGCGVWSATATETVAWIPATPTTFHRQPPPQFVHAGDTYTLAWDTMAHATSYELSFDGGAAGVGIAGTSTTEQAPGGQGDITLDWRVRACGAGGCSAWSATLGVYVVPTSPPPCLTPPCIQPKIATAPKVADGSGSPSGALVADTAYTATGYPETLTRNNDGSVYAHIAAMDAWGHATEVYEGGTDSGNAAVTLIRGYNQATGLATSTAATNAANAAVASLTTAWDGFGNLTSRSEHTSAMTGTSTEANITYDALNRLTGSTTTLSGGGSLTRSYSYDASGNRTQACANGVCTTYSYGTNGAGPHAVSAVNGNTGGYAYNADGEMTTDADRTLYWSAFGKATSIAKGNTTVTIDYGPGDSRYRKEVIGPNPETVTYLGGAERLDINGNLSIRRTLSLGGITIIDTGGAQSKRLYPVTDHLGSTIAVVDNTGSLVQGLAYGDFGRRYATQWVGLLSTSQAVNINQNQTDKGYTGQESLDSIGLDDYNARLYDPGLGRFLSVDPLIGHQGSTQSINPYSYVENNPLNKTDPTGEVSCVPSGNGKTMTCTSTPTGSHIPQTSTLNTSTGKFSGQGALPGGGLALTTDAHTTLTVTVKSNGQGQGAKAANAGKNNPSDHTKLGPSKNEMGFLKGWEKYSDHPYDSNNDGTVDTIGWGHTMSKADVKAYEGLKNAINDLPLMHGLGLGKVIADEAFTITPEQGAKFLQQDVAAAESRLMKVFPIKTLRGLKQNQYDALFDLEFNAGIHKSWNLVKDINAGKYNAAAQEFLNIDKSGSKEMGGLKTRRQEEETMFLYDKYDWSH